MQLSRDTKRFFLFLALFTVALLLCVNHVAAIAGWIASALTLLSPFLVGACMAFIISVPMRLFDRILSRRRKTGKPLVKDQTRKPLSMVLSILLILLLLVVFGSIVVPQLVDTVASLAGSVMRFVPTAQRWITELMTWLEGYPEVHEDLLCAEVRRYCRLIPGIQRFLPLWQRDGRDHFVRLCDLHSLANQHPLPSGQKAPLRIPAQALLR